MFTTNDLVIDVHETLGETLLLTKIFPAYEYKDHVKTDHIIGYYYTIVAADKDFKKIYVKILGAKRMEVEEHKYRVVKLDDPEFKIYAINGDVKICCEAKGIHAIVNSVDTAKNTKM